MWIFDMYHIGMLASKRLGEMGEYQAALYLKSKGWEVLMRNFGSQLGEIDIVCRDSGGVIAFVEVKSSGSFYDGFDPEDHVDDQKLRKLKRMCALFVAKHPSLFMEEQEWRIDVLSLIFKSDKRILVRHYRGIF